jgi:hypothetical protein
MTGDYSVRLVQVDHMIDAADENHWPAERRVTVAGGDVQVTTARNESTNDVATEAVSTSNLPVQPHVRCPQPTDQDNHPGKGIPGDRP